MENQPFAGAGDPSFRALLEAAPDATIIVGDDGLIALANSHAEAMFGYARSELIGRPIEVLVPSRYHGSHERQRRAYASAARTRPMGAGLDLRARRKDGSEFPAEISLSPLETERGTFIVSAIRDMTDRRAAEAERQRLIQERAAHAEASRVKDEFIATLSHELRTPLNAILGWATIIDDHVLPADKAERAVKTIIRNARAQIQLIEELLDISRIVSGKMTIRPQPIDLAEVVESAAEVVRPSAAAKQLRLDVHVEARPVFLIGDPDRLEQVVWNLLSNAIKFSNPNGRVEVRVRGGDTSAELLVRDTGRGIDPRFLPHVFDRFRQADSSYTREHGGLGLGLALVKSIVELHGGTVDASSSGPGLGAAFRVTLPSGLSRRPFASPAAPTAVPRRLDKARILVVDDQADERELLATILGAHGADVQIAASVRDALDLVAAYRPNVLVTDIAMPGEDGYTLLRQVRAMAGFERLPAVAVTAHARVEDRDLAESAGFNAYLSKPIDPLRLVGAIAGLPSVSS